MLSKKINDELTEVDGDLNELNARREKLIDCLSRAIAAEGSVNWAEVHPEYRSAGEKAAEADLELDELHEKLYAEADEKVVVASVTNEEKDPEPDFDSDPTQKKSKGKKKKDGFAGFGGEDE